jgi:hypothetical protein
MAAITKKVSEEKIFLISSPLFSNLHNRSGMVPRWVPFKIVSDSPALHSRWPLLLKIEISSNGQNCYILSQNVPKFELYKHNDELFSMCDRIFYELFGWKSGSTDHFWKGAIQESFQQNLVDIGSVVSEENFFF